MKETLGDNMSIEIEEKQKELKNWISKIGMTQKYFAEQYFIEEYANLNEEEIKAFYEKFKGHLKRSTTPIETIDIYLNYLYGMDEFKKAGYVKPVSVDDGLFDNEFNKKMTEISKMITKNLEEKGK